MTDLRTNISDREIRDWLLRRLDTQRNAAIEEQLFVDPDLADRVDGVECDLIDDCAHGRLPADDARIVQSHDAWRMRFARAFAELQRPATAQTLRRARAPWLRRAWPSAAIAASVLFAIVTFSWNSMAPMPMETASTALLPVVVLKLEQRRDAATPLELPPNDGNVRLQAEIDDDSTGASSRYVLSVAEGEHVLFMARDLAARYAGPYRFVEAIIPASSLGPAVRRIAVRLEGAQDSSAHWDVQMRRPDVRGPSVEK